MLLAPHTGEKNGPVNLAITAKLKMPGLKLAAGAHAVSAGSPVWGFGRRFRYG